METPFPCGPPPNHAGPFPSTWLSGDLRRGDDRVGVDGVVAGGADHEGLASFGRHEHRPRGLAWSGLPEAGELADLVHVHLARVAAHSSHRCVKSRWISSLRGWGAGFGIRSWRTASLSRTRGIPPNRATRSGLPLRWILASKQVRSPYRVVILAWYLVAIFDTVDWCLAARVFSIDVRAYQCRSSRRQTSTASR